MAGYMATSQTVEWGTPKPLFFELNKEFGFTLDAAAQPYNAKCSTFYTPELDGLKQPWPGRVWLNPPYGAVIAEWVSKALIEITAGKSDLIVMLLPARTDAAWFHKLLAAKAEIRFIQGRLRFEKPDGSRMDSATFPSIIVILRRGA